MLQTHGSRSLLHTLSGMLQLVTEADDVILVTVMKLVSGTVFYCLLL